VDGSYVVAYYCKNAASQPCPSRAYVHADELDAFVEGWFTEALRSVHRLIDVVSAGRELEEAQRALERLERDLRGYVEVEDATDPVLFRQGLEARQGRVTEARERVGHLSARLTRIPAGGSLSALWGGFDVARRRPVLRGFLDRVEVGRGASADLAGNVRIFWSNGAITGRRSRHRESRRVGRSRRHAGHARGRNRRTHVSQPACWVRAHAILHAARRRPKWAYMRELAARNPGSRSSS
jgi:hypothetical protein